MGDTCSPAPDLVVASGLRQAAQSSFCPLRICMEGLIHLRPMIKVGCADNDTRQQACVAPPGCESNDSDICPGMGILDSLSVHAKGAL